MASIGLENEHDLFLWNIIFEGPSDTLYDVSNLTLIAFAAKNE
jgi:ubiquitin-protein ligase